MFWSQAMGRIKTSSPGMEKSEEDSNCGCFDLFSLNGLEKMKRFPREVMKKDSPTPIM